LIRLARPAQDFELISWLLQGQPHITDDEHNESQSRERVQVQEQECGQRQV